MTVQGDVKIVGYMPVEFACETEERKYYDAIVERWSDTGSLAFLASAFYNLGKVHGVRLERARRK